MKLTIILIDDGGQISHFNILEGEHKIEEKLLMAEELPQNSDED